MVVYRLCIVKCIVIYQVCISSVYMVVYRLCIVKCIVIYQVCISCVWSGCV